MLTIKSIIDRHAKEQGDLAFLIDGENGDLFSYKDLHAKVTEIGKYLNSLNLSKGDKVAFLMDNGPFTTFLFLAIAYSGFVIVPINAVAGKLQTEYILSHSDAKVLFVSEHYKTKMHETIDLFYDKIEIITADEQKGFCNGSISDNKEHKGQVADKEITKDSDALLIYTSGTTGQPKGVLLTHKNIIAGGQNTTKAHELTKDDRALCVLPLYHINGQIVTVLTPLVSGSSLVMPKKFSAKKFWGLIAEYKCTWFSAVPTIISYLLNDATSTSFDKTRLPEGLFGRSASAALPKALHIKFEKTFGISIIETMGLSETAAQILSNPREPSKIKYGSPGIPYGNEVELIDDNDKIITSANESGEIIIKGDNVMKCYYKNPLETKKTFINGDWLRSGDLAKKDEDGFFFVTGRKKELIIKGGENIAPREIDDVLYKYPGVLEASAFGTLSDDYGEEVLACIVTSDIEVDVEKLKAFCKKYLDSFKVPKEIIISKEPLPKGPSGKIQRLKLTKQYKDYLKKKV